MFQLMTELQLLVVCYISETLVRPLMQFSLTDKIKKLEIRGDCQVSAK